MSLTLQFWSGDLNYRLDLDDQEVWGLVQSADWEALLVGDQLLNDISQSQSFTGFSEPKINFRP